MLAGADNDVPADILDSWTATLKEMNCDHSTNGCAGYKTTRSSVSRSASGRFQRFARARAGVETHVYPARLLPNEGPPTAARQTKGLAMSHFLGTGTPERSTSPADDFRGEARNLAVPEVVP